jgi:tetratricopeptide (TPR) repeat protein
MIKTTAYAGVLLAATAALAQPSPPAPSPQPTPPAPSPQPTPPAPSPAADEKTDEQKKAEAKRLYEEGLQHYNLGEYDSAISKFKSAYAISSAVGLLFNVAQSYRLKKDWEQASNFYLTYLRLKPDAPNRSDVEQRIAEMQKMIEEAKAMERRPPSGTVPPEEVSTPKEAVTVNVVTGGAGAKAEGGGSSQSLITAGYATAGAGAALVITGVVFGQMAKSAEKQLNQLSADMGTWTPEHQSTYDSGKRNNTIAVIAFIAGGAAVATGATLWTLGTLSKSKEPKLAIDAGKQGASVSIGWSF